MSNIAKAKTPTQKKEDEKLLVRQLLAKAFGIPMQGIVLAERFGNKPYINALGLKMAWLKYPELVKIKEVIRVHTYEKIGDQALVLVKGEYKIGDKYQLMRDIGSASAANLSMTKGYPNEMAYTRAFSRFLRWRLMPQLLEDFEKNVKNMKKEERQVLEKHVADFGTVSLEEMPTVDESKVESVVMLTVEQMEQIKPILEELTQVRSQEDLDTVFTEAEYLKEKEGLNKKQREEIRKAILAVVKKYNLPIPTVLKKGEEGKLPLD